MSNAVLAETGPLSTSRPITLRHYGGAQTATRGVFAELEQTEVELRGAFSESKFNAWVPTPAIADRVAMVEVEGVTYRALDTERILGAFTDPLLQHDTTRYELVGT